MNEAKGSEKMEQNQIRLLRANEIECRIATINEKGLSLLLYKDARVDQRILDETFGAFGWKRSHQCIDGNLYCTVEIFDKESGEWVSKQDVGTTGYTEKEKSQASDSFKRACFNWGIGRELYTAPFIWIPAAKAGLQKKGDRYFSHECFAVNAISYNDSREIISLEITDSRGQIVYVLRQSGHRQESDNRKTKQKGDSSAPGRRQEGTSIQRPAQAGKRETTDSDPMDNRSGAGGISETQEIILMAELNRTGVALDEVLDRYGIDSLSRMTPEIYSKAIAALKQTKPKNGMPVTAA